MAEAAGKSDKLNAFISYSRDDLDFADQLDLALGLLGFGTTIDRHGILAGEDWQSRLGALIRDADTVVFVLSPSSARSKTCAWEVAEAVRLGKRILPVLCRSLEDASPPPQLAKFNYIYFYAEPRFPGSGFGLGLVGLASALNTDLDWLREHTRYLQRATEWDTGGRSASRLLSGPDIASAKAWAARRPKDAPEPTSLQLDFVKASENEETRQQSAEAQRLQEMEQAQNARAEALAERERAQQQEAEARKNEAEAQKREAEQARRVALRTKLGLAGVSIFALAAAVVAVYAFWQRDLAKEQHDLAVARQLATEARVVFDLGGKSPIQLQRSLLLATASLKFAWTQEGFEAWSKAIELQPPNPSTLGREGPYTAVTFSRDGSRVAVAGKDSIAVMDSASLTDGTPPKILAKLPQAGVTALAFKPPDGQIVVGGTVSAAIVWSLSGPRQVKELPGDGQSRFESIAFDSQGKRLAAAGYNYHARTFETEGWTETGWVGNEAAMAVAFSPDDRWLLTIGARVVAWNVESATRNPPGNPIAPVDPDSFVVIGEHAGANYLLSFSGDGRWLADGSGLRSVVPTEAQQKFSVSERVFDSSSDPIIAVSSDAGLAATGGGGEIVIWRGDARRMQFLQSARIPASAVAFAPTGDWLIGAVDDRLERWDLAAGAEWRRLVHGAGVLDVAVNHDARFLGTTTVDGSAHVWETNTWREIFKAEIHRTEGGTAESNIAFSADGHWLSATSQNVVKIFSTDGWNQVATRELENTIHSAVFSSDLKWLVVTDGTELTFVAVNSWVASRFVLEGVDTVLISPDGRQLLTSSEPFCGNHRHHQQTDGFVRVWEISSGKQLTDNSLPCHPEGGEKQDRKPGGAQQDTNRRDWKPIPLSVNAPSNWTSPDGAWIVGGNFESATIELSASSASAVKRPGISHRAGGVYNTAFSPDGKWFVTASNDGVARIWTLDRATMIVEACARMTHDLSRDDQRRILGEEPYSPVCPGLPPLQ